MSRPSGIRPAQRRGGGEDRGRMKIPREAHIMRIMTGHVRQSPQEVEARAKAIYERDVRPKVESEHRGKFLVLDVESGDFEIDADRIAASDRAHAKHPAGVFYSLRIGERSMGRIGFVPRESAG